MKERSEVSRFLVITGLSGAGKSTAIKSLEDMGFYCVDNLPLVLLPELARWYLDTTQPFKKVALGIDVREGESLKELPMLLKELRVKGIEIEILYLDAEDEAILKRFKETRRVHPLRGITIEDSLRKERELLAPLKREAGYVLDTTEMDPHQLKGTIRALLSEEDRMVLMISSFGFKHGIPKNLDLLFDVRFLPNPHFQAELRDKNGLDADVIRFLLSQEETNKFLARLKNFILYLLPKYSREGKSYLSIGVGCTGGMHRSVVVVEWLGKALERKGYRVRIYHRELEAEDWE